MGTDVIVIAIPSLGATVAATTTPPVTPTPASTSQDRAIIRSMRLSSALSACSSGSRSTVFADAPLSKGILRATVSIAQSRPRLAIMAEC